MMHGIISIDKIYLEEVLQLIDDVMSFDYDEQTVSYSHIIDHLTEDKHVLIIRFSDIELMKENYQKELEKIGKELIESISVLDRSEWVIDEEIDM